MYLEFFQIFEIFWDVSRLLKVIEVTTDSEHKKCPKKGQHCIKRPQKTQELEVGPRSWPYLRIVIKQ